MAAYCEVALPVPLRSTFTYALRASMDVAPHDGNSLVGRRVVVPFRNRAMTGVAVKIFARGGKADFSPRSKWQSLLQQSSPQMTKLEAYG